MKILGIETSCDETAAAVVEDGRILSSVVSSQIELHQETQGIVPEVAARAHIERAIPVVSEALGEPWPSRNRGSRPAVSIGPGGPNIDAIAVTVGPGLVSSLMVGVDTAKALAFAWDRPLIAVNHLEGHFYAAKLAESPDTRHQAPGLVYPVIALIVSGGHTMLVLSEKEGHYEMLGQTLDDAAGEAFDKVAKLLDLGYPGGPIISKLAAKGRRDACDFPRPMLADDNFNFSFSGIKTSVLYLLRGVPGKRATSNKQQATIKKEDICASFEQAVVDTLVGKTAKAVKRFNPKTVILTGGVAANSFLRENLAKRMNKDFPNTTFIVPPIEHCTDNAAMIALAGEARAKQKEYTPLDKITVDPNLGL